MHIQGKLLENRNRMLKAQGINETLFMALVTMESQASRSIQPSELSSALGSSRTNATRIADELEKRGGIERKESENDRRRLHLHLTDAGQTFLDTLLPPQYNCLLSLWSTLNEAEKQQLESLIRKLLNKRDTFILEEDVLKWVLPLGTANAEQDPPRRFFCGTPPSAAVLPPPLRQ